jgi:hypothetical protein
MNVPARTSRIPWAHSALAAFAIGVLLAGCGAASTSKAAEPTTTGSAASTPTTAPTSPPLTIPKAGIYSNTGPAPFAGPRFAVANRYLGPYGRGWVYIWAGGLNPPVSSSSSTLGMRPGLRVYTGPPTTSPRFGKLTFVGQYSVPISGWASVTSVTGSTVTLLVTRGGQPDGDGAVYHGPAQVEVGTVLFDLTTHTLSGLLQSTPQPAARTYADPCGHPLPAHLLDAVNTTETTGQLAPFPATSVAPATSGIIVPVSCQEAVATTHGQWPRSTDLGVGLATFTSRQFPKGRPVWAVDIDAPFPEPGARRQPGTVATNFIVELVDAYTRADLGSLTGTSSFLPPLLPPLPAPSP